MRQGLNYDKICHRLCLRLFVDFGPSVASHHAWRSGSATAAYKEALVLATCYSGLDTHVALVWSKDSHGSLRCMDCGTVRNVPIVGGLAVEANAPGYRQSLYWGREKRIHIYATAVQLNSASQLEDMQGLVGSTSGAVN